MQSKWQIQDCISLAPKNSRIKFILSSILILSLPLPSLFLFVCSCHILILIIDTIIVFWFYSPHLCVGFLFLVVHARLPPASRLLPHNPHTHATYSHIIGSGGGFGSRLAPLSPRLFVWQAWPLATSKCALHGRRGTWRQRRAFCVAGVALMALAGSGRALGSRLAPLSGRQAVRQAGRQTDRHMHTHIHTFCIRQRPAADRPLS